MHGPIVKQFMQISVLCAQFPEPVSCLITILSTTLQEIKSQVRIAILLLSRAAQLEKLERLC